MEPADVMTWQRTVVAGRAATYGALGSGPPVVFLHGWGLSDHTYRHALTGLVDRGVRVYAPALPGFGGTDPLPRAEFSLSGYAAWVDLFLEGLGIDEPVTLVGHSFGGGVALKAAHDFPHRVGRLVLVNSIGGSVWRQRGAVPRTMRERPLWDWGLHLTAQSLSLRTLTRTLPVVAADALPNVLRHPHVLWRVGGLARDANLGAELEVLKRRRVPVVILWGKDDSVIPWACAESLASALHAPEMVTVPGDHGWLLTDPNRFAEILTNIVNLPFDTKKAPRRGPPTTKAS